MTAHDASSSRPPKRVAFFGGSFNPPHVAHLLAAVYALSTTPIDLVLVVPVFRHPFAKELAPYEDRLAMCRLAFGLVPSIEVSTLEGELGGESLTLRTLEHLTTAHPEWRLRLMVGADVLADLPKWHRFDRIAEIAPPLVLGRQGVPVAQAGHDLQPSLPLLPPVSSSELRQMLAQGRVDEVRDRLPHAVADYIATRRLYGALEHG